MAKINNQEVMQKLVDELELYPAKDVIPTELAEKILPVFQVNSDEVTVSNTPATIVRDTSLTLPGEGTSGTIYTTPSSSTKTFYLTSVQLHIHASDELEDQYRTFSIRVTQDGTVRKVAFLGIYNNLGSTFFSEVVNLTFNNPIPVDAGTNITLNRDTANVSNVCCCSISGYNGD